MNFDSKAIRVKPTPMLVKRGTTKVTCTICNNVLDSPIHFEKFYGCTHCDAWVPESKIKIEFIPDVPLLYLPTS